MMVLALCLAMLTVQDDYAEAYNNIRDSISSKHYEHRRRKQEIQERLDHYQPLALRAQSREEFRDIVNQMIAEFNDSHFLYSIEGDQSYYLNECLSQVKAEPMPNIGAWYLRKGQSYTVQMVLEGSPAEKAGIRKGDRMIAVDEANFTPVNNFRSDIGKIAHVRFEHGEKIKNAEIPISCDTVFDMFLAASKQSIRTFEVGKYKIGYVHPWMLINQNFEMVVSEAYRKNIHCDGFILDLRDGFGGHPDGIPEIFDRFRKPMVVLINEGTRSAREVVSFLLRKHHGARLIGRHTAGNVLGTWPKRINAWSNIEIPMTAFDVEGQTLEKVGIEPDVKVPREFDAKGNDLDLAEALKYFQRVIPTSIAS
jgi:carboxyl-terminal processing protease